MQTHSMKRYGKNREKPTSKLLLTSIKRCPIQLNLNLLNFSKMWLHSRTNYSIYGKRKKEKKTFILIVCRFLVHLHQLSALLRFLHSHCLSSLSLSPFPTLFLFSSLLFSLMSCNSLSIRMEKVPMFCLTQCKTLFSYHFISFFIWWRCRQHVYYTKSKTKRMRNREANELLKAYDGNGC